MSTTRSEGESLNGALLEAFRHNSWATRHLLAFCRDLSEEQLTAAPAGSYGGIRATFHHIVRSEGGYLRRLAGSGPAWVDRDAEAHAGYAGPAGERDLDQLTAWVEELEQLWEQYLSEPIDADQVYIVDEGANAVRAGVIVAQVLHHGNAHREQICAIITGFGIQPPDLQPWEYAWATGRIWEQKPGD